MNKFKEKIQSVLLGDLPIRFEKKKQEVLALKSTLKKSIESQKSTHSARMKLKSRNDKSTDILEKLIKGRASTFSKQDLRDVKDALTGETKRGKK
jgi:hypothetical protein